MSLLFTTLLSTFVLSVQCQEDIRLAGRGSTTNRGRVEVLRNGIWGTVCNDDFDDNAATVVCRMLNFTNGGINISNTNFGPGSGPIWLDGFQCSGTEPMLENCLLSGSGWNNSNCNHSEDAAVECTVLNNPVVVRLVPPGFGFGYVEAFINGTWGAICNSVWNIYNARVICRQLGYNSSEASAGAPARLITAWNNTSRYFVMDNLDCKDGEPSIFNCTYQTSSTCDVQNRHRYGSVTCVKFPSTPSQTIVPSLTCTNGEFRAEFSKQNRPTIREDHFILAKPNITCNLNKNTILNAIIISFGFHDCGTIYMGNLTHIMYINELVYQEPNAGNPTVVTSYSISLRCEFKRSQNSSAGVIQPITEQVTQVAPGQYTTRLDFYTDDTLSTPITSYPIQIVVGEYVYVAAILDTAESNLKLVIQNCRATSNSNPNSLSSHSLIVNKCPHDAALALSFLPVNKTMYGFVYKSFKFLNSDDLYIHCDLTVCLANETTGQCDRYCATSAGRRRKREAPIYASFHVRSPPIHFVSEIYYGNQKTNVCCNISLNIYLLTFVIILKIFVSDNDYNSN